MRGSIKYKGRRNGEKLWAIRWDAPASPNGKRRQKFHLFEGTYRQAEKFLADRLAEADKVGSTDAGHMTVGQLLDQWLAVSAKPRLRESSYASCEYAVRVHIKPRIGNVLLRRLTSPVIAEFVANVQQSGRVKDGGPLSKRTAQIVYVTLRQALSEAVAWRFIGSNPADGVKSPVPDEPNVKPLKPEQVGLFLDHIKDRPEYALYLTILTTGLRESEILGLKWEDIDFETNVLHLSHQLTRRKGRAVPGPLKTASGKRSILLSPAVVDALRRHRAATAELRQLMGDKWKEHGLVFPSLTGTPIGHRNLLRQLTNLLKRAGLPHVTVHGLRHTGATLLLEAGVHPKVAAERLGHSNPVMFMRKYSHVLETLQQDAAAKVEDIVLKHVGRPKP